MALQIEQTYFFELILHFVADADADSIYFRISFREEKRTQTQASWSRFFRVGWGSSTWMGGRQKVRYVPRNQGNQIFWAGYPGILLGYPRGARKVWEKKACVQFSFPIVFRCRCRQSCSPQLRVGSTADASKLGHNFYFVADTEK